VKLNDVVGDEDFQFGSERKEPSGMEKTANRKKNIMKTHGNSSL
jgi:hypothetical protein